MNNVGFVVFSPSDIEVLKLDGAERLYEVDDFLRNFKDEEDFKCFLKNIMRVSNVDDADVFIYSMGKGKKRFSDLIFNKKSKEYNDVLNTILKGDTPNYTHLLQESFGRYKKSPKYKMLFDSAFNNCYEEFTQLVYDHKEADFSALTFGRKLNWLLEDKGAYNNFRELIYLRDLLFSNSNTLMKDMKDLCDNKSEINSFREKYRKKIEEKINEIGHYSTFFSSKFGAVGLRDLIVPNVALPMYDAYKKDNNEKQLLDSDSENKSNNNNDKLTKEELRKRKKYIIKTLLDESALPRRCLVYIEEPKILYIDEKRLPSGFDKDLIANLYHRIPFNFLIGLYNVKEEWNRYNEFKYIEPNDAERLKDDMYSRTGTMTKMNRYLDGLIDKKDKGTEELTDFDYIYLFAKAAEEAKKTRDATKGISEEEDEYDPLAVEATRKAALERIKSLRKGSNGGRTR